MINLFSLASDDQSVAYLGQIFGYVGSVLPVNNPPLLVSILFKTLNTVALTIGAILVVYVTVVGLLKTAQEGEFLGRQWNALWVPVRTVLGIAALFPTSTGYSAIQVVIMWIILQGVGAADTLWTKTLQYVAVAGSPYAAVGGVDSTTARMQLQPTMQWLFQGLLCQASAKATYAPVPMSRASGAPSKSIQYYCGDPNYSAQKGFCTDTDADMLNPVSGPQVTGNVYSLGPAGKCGSMTLCDEAKECPKADPSAPDSPGCIACKTQRAALASIVPVLGAVATQIVVMDHQYAQFHEYQKPPVIEGEVSTQPAPPPVPPPDWAKTYCSEKGVSPSECCVYEGKNCTSIFPKAVEDLNDLMNTSHAMSASGAIMPSESATELYLAYPLGAYLNGSDFINAAVGEYLAAMVSAVSADIQKRMDKIGTSGYGTLDKARSQGWIFAGIFYYNIAGRNQQDQKAVITIPAFAAPSKPKNPLPFEASPDEGYRSNYEAASDLIKAMTKANTSSVNFTNNNAVSGISGDVSDALNMASGALLQGWQQSLMGTGTGQFNVQATNPLIAIASFGYSMMQIAQVLFVVLTVTAAFLVGLATTNLIFLGNGFTATPWGEALKATLNMVSPFFVILVSSLFTIGAMLGLYVPLIPFMIFSLGAMGWLIATVEAMVAGPIIALGILSPGGQHDILGRAEPALMQIFNLFLRPGLMIIGLVVSMFMSIVILKLINAGFAAVALSTGGSPMLFEQILLIAIYTSFVITGMNKAFSLIYVIPEKILTYLGVAPTSYGEEQAMGASKQALESAASATTQGAKESGAAAAHGAEKYATSMRTQEEKGKQDKATAAKGTGDAQVTPKQGGGKTD
ncbi:MAG TPA: DotA/TraY family protein [Gammaproteobacteria bacterium]|nr:DotA/TraY family protein [Gammaproteobacteria bacterium]